MDVASLFSDFPWFADNLAIDEIYHLDHLRLFEILQKFTHKIILRENGIEIFGKLKKDGAETTPTLGMIVTGKHLQKDISEIYLVTLKPIGKEHSMMKPEYNLVDLLRQYII